MREHENKIAVRYILKLKTTFTFGGILWSRKIEWGGEE